MGRFAVMMETGRSRCWFSRIAGPEERWQRCSRCRGCPMIYGLSPHHGPKSTLGVIQCKLKHHPAVGRVIEHINFCAPRCRPSYPDWLSVAGNLQLRMIKCVVALTRRASARAPERVTFRWNVVTCLLIVVASKTKRHCAIHHGYSRFREVTQRAGIRKRQYS